MNVMFDVIRWIYYNKYVKITLRYVTRFSSTSAQSSGDSTKAGQAQSCCPEDLLNQHRIVDLPHLHTEVNC